MKPFYEDASVTLYHADAMDVLRLQHIVERLAQGELAL